MTDDTSWLESQGLLAGFIPSVARYFMLIYQKSQTQKDVGKGSVFYMTVVMTMYKFMIVNKRLCESYADELIGLIGSNLDPMI